MNRIMEFWCGLASLKEIKLKATVTRDSDQALLNGTALEDDEGIASQDDIDTLFD